MAMVVRVLHVRVVAGEVPALQVVDEAVGVVVEPVRDLTRVRPDVGVEVRMRHVGARVDDGNDDGIAPLRDVPGERRADRVQAPELRVERVGGGGVELVGPVRAGGDDVAPALERAIGRRERGARFEPGADETAERHALDECRADRIERALLCCARLEAHKDLLRCGSRRSGIAGSGDPTREGKTEHGEEGGS